MKNINKIDAFIILFFAFSILFMRYITVFTTEWYVVDLVIIGYLLVKSLNKRFEVNIPMLFSFIFVILIVLINIITFGIGSNAFDNLRIVLFPLTFLYFLLYLKKNYSIAILKSLISKLTIFLNTYFFINSLVIFVQIKTESFMMENFLLMNPHSFDHMTGFIGYNGVSVLNFVWIATLLLNLYAYFDNRSRLNLNLVIVELVVMQIISLFNENKMFLPTLLIFGSLFLFFQFIKFKGLSKSFFRIILILFSIAFMFVVSYFSFDNVSQMTDKVFSLVDDFFYDNNSKPVQYNERAYLQYLAFNVYNADGLGIGLNSIDLSKQTIHEHLGINSASYIMIQGGAIYLFSILNLYSVTILNLVRCKNIFTNFIIYILVFTSLGVVSYASQPFGDHYIFGVLSLIYFIYYLQIPKEKK